MKNKLYPLTFSLFATVFLIVAGCGTFGRNPSPPSPLESSLFHVTTNYAPVVTVQTNVISVTLYQTNTVTVPQTNTIGVITYQTNSVTVPVLTFQTNTATVTNLQAQYNYGPGGTLSGAQGIVSSIPVYGALASTLLGVIGSVWGWLRSTKNRQTAANTMQVVETMRSFIQALPNGANYDNALVQWMQAHQAQAGVLDNVLSLLANEVSNPDAQFAANSVIATINGLSATPTIPTPAPAAPKV